MKIFGNILFLVLFLLVFTGADITPQERYITKYAPVAVSEMRRTGVPASITLAQGLLESSNGLSPLAKNGNNHFGIKCHDWTGKKQYKDDDKRNECFRAYDKAESSFRDHSDFLRYRDRYKFLFDYGTSDYKSWAYGLKKAGYATDPAYPAKLIKLIEDYHLDQYDEMSTAQAKKLETSTETEQIVPLEQETTNKADRRTRRKAKVRKTRKSKSESQPQQIGPTERIVEQASESHSFSLSRQKYSLNGVPFVYALEGESLSSIASSNGLFVKEVLKFNDMSSASQLRPGMIVYLQSKKKATAKAVEKYIPDTDGESLWEVSQKFAVRLSELAKRNNLPAGYVLRAGDVIKLR